MKRLIVGIVVVAAIVVAAVAVLPFLVSSDSVRARIIEKAESLTGRRMSFRAAPKVFFNPYLGIAIDSVIFEGPKRRPGDQPLVEMDELRGRVSILPALIGRVEITQYQFVRPRFNLEVFEDGHVSWAFPDGRVWQVLDEARRKRQATEPNAKTDLSGIARLTVGQFEIIDGVVNYRNRQTGTSETITNVNARIIWPDTASSWTISGKGIWRDEAIEFSTRASQPLLFMAGGAAEATATIKSSALQFNFQGDADMLSGLHLSGTASLSAPSIPRLVNLLGGEMQARSTPGQFAASGKINGTLNQVQFTDADITVDGNRGRGVLLLGRVESGRLQVNATLAFKTFDFTPYLSAFQQEAEINRQQLSGLRLLDRFDLDIRISATTAKLGALDASDLAAALSVRNSELLFDLGNAALGGGTAMGSLSIKRSGDGVKFSSQASLSGVALAPALAAVQPNSPVGLNAKGDVKLKLESTGSSARQVIEGLHGWAGLKAGKGTLTGADLGRLHSAAGGDGEPDNVLALSGQTDFNALNGDFIFDHGSVWIRDFVLTGKDMEARLSGRTDLASGGLALRVRLSKIAAKADAGADAKAAEPDVLLFVGGVINSPLVTRDRQSEDGTEMQWFQ